MVDRLCPHLARPEPFLLPLTRPWERAYLGAGVLLYDVLGGTRPAVPRHRHLSRRAALEEMPDCARTASGGAPVPRRAGRRRPPHARRRPHGGAPRRGRAPPRRGDGPAPRGRARRGRPRARSRGRGELEIRARAVVNATGVWAEALQAMAGDVQLAMRPAKGVHVVVPRERIASRTGLIARAGDSVVVMRPWWRHWISAPPTPRGRGRATRRPPRTATSTACSRRQPLAAAAAGPRGRDRRLRRPAPAALGRSGRRPPRCAATTPCSDGAGPDDRRRRQVHDLPGDGRRGGRRGGCRGSGAEAVAPPSGRPGGPRLRRRRLEHRPRPASRRRRPRRRPRVGRSYRARERPLARGGRAPHRPPRRAARRRARGAGRPARAAPGAPGTPYLEAEVVHAATHEGALRLEDVLERRTHCSIETADHGLAAAPRAAELLARRSGGTTRGATRRWRRTSNTRKSASRRRPHLPSSRVSANTTGGSRARSPSGPACGGRRTGSARGAGGRAARRRLPARAAATDPIAHDPTMVKQGRYYYVRHHRGRGGPAPTCR